MTSHRLRPRPRAASLSLAASALLVPLLALPGQAQPAAQPATRSPAAATPAERVAAGTVAPGTSACTVTQGPVDGGPLTVHGKPRKLKLTRVKEVRRSTQARRTGGKWRVAVSARVVWKGSATADATQTFAAPDCDMAARKVTATGTRSTRAAFTTRRTGVASTKKAATRAAVKKLRVATKSWARGQVVGGAQARAAANARAAFLATLPHRAPEYRGPKAGVTAAQACPAKTRTAWSKTSSRAATVVPQLGTPATIWRCTYDLDGHVIARTKLSGAAKRAALAEVRALAVPDPRMAILCPTNLLPSQLVSLVGRDGSVTRAFSRGGGCRETTLSATPAKVGPHAGVAPRVPSGYYRPGY